TALHTPSLHDALPISHPEAARACGNLTQMKKSVPVAELKMGMYVAELDRPWTETPFMFQGFYLETGEQLETLKQYCKTVFVDPRSEEHTSELQSRVDL